MKRVLNCFAVALMLCLSLLLTTALASNESEAAADGAAQAITADVVGTQNTLYYRQSGKAKLSPAGGILTLNATPVADKWDTEGYKWEVVPDGEGGITSGTLTLAEGFDATKVSIPDADVKIVTNRESRIGELVFTNPQKTNLTFSGTGKLTIDKNINISGGHYNSLTVDLGADVVANNGISIGADGGVDSAVTVNGHLSVKQGEWGSAIYAGRVAVGNTGILGVHGTHGVLLNGMPKNSGEKYKDLFTVKGDGRFTADCSVLNIYVYAADPNLYPKKANGETDAGAVISLGADYLPDDCEARVSADGTEINLVRKSTGEVYTGPITIHLKHDWLMTEWAFDGTSHWYACTFEGCDKRNLEAAHSFEWKNDENGHWQVCTVCGCVTEGTEHSFGEYKYDASGHWKECTDCGRKS